MDQPVLDMHASYAGLRGTLGVEYYNNTVNAGQTYRYLHPRGGVFICFSNTFTDTAGLGSFCHFDDTGGENSDWITNSFVWGNRLNGVAQNNSMINTSSSRFVLNGNYWTVPPSSANGKPVGVYQNYTPLVHPHPLVTAQDLQSRPGPPTIISDPANATVTAGQAANFSVTATGDAPLSYQWKWYSTNVAGATASSWTTPALVLGNSGSSVAVEVTNPAGGVLSGSATLTVNAQSAPNVITINDASSSAINAAISSAPDGSIIRVNATGTVTWTSTVQLPSTKSISLIGPGTNTPKGSAIFPLVIISNQKPAVGITSATNRFYRVSGFKFQNPTLNGDTSGYWNDSFISVRGRGTGPDGVGAYRIDNNYFDHVGNNTTVGLDGSTGELTGLVDNNTFLDVGQNTVVYVIRIRETWKGASSTCYGGDAWQRPFAFGSRNFHFIEDNLFSRPTSEGRHDVSCDGAAGKYVIRHNTFNRSYNSSYQMDYIDAHGDGTPGLGSGTRGGEIYGNSFQGTSGAVGRDINLRGGQWLVYDNTFPSYGYVAMTEYRASSADSSQLDSPSLCNPGVPQFATPSDFAAWYPLPGQIQGTYFWNNIYNSANLSPQVATENYVPTYIVPNRDYWVSSSKPTALANYTPFTYPHPLSTGQQQVSTNPVTQVSPTSLVYEVPVGSSSSQTVSIHNAGQGTLTGTASLTTGSSPSPWSIIGPTKYTNNASITIGYSPTTSGDSTATLTLTDNGGGATVSLLGTLPKVYIECVGDSLTRGGASTTANFVPGGYRLPLYQILTNQGINAAFTGSTNDNSAAGLPYPQHDGYGGYEIGDIASSYPTYASVIQSPDYVLLQCGLNDFRHNNAITQATNRLSSLITQIATTFPDAKIIVADMNPWDNLGVTNAAMNLYYNPYIPAVVSSQAASGRTVFLADMRQPYLTVDDVQADNTHFTQSGYNKMASRFASVISAIISGTNNVSRPQAPSNLRVVGAP